MRLSARFAALLLASLTLGLSHSHAQDAPAPAAGEQAVAASAWQPFPGAVEAGAVNSGMLEKDVVLTGTIKEVIPSMGERSPHQIILGTSGAAKVMVVFWPDAAPVLLGTKGLPAVGTRLSAKGRLGEHRGNLQVRVRTADQLRIEGYGAPGAGATAAAGAAAVQSATGVAAPAEAPYYSVRQATTDRGLIGKELSVKGTIKEFTAAWSERAPNIVALEEDGKRLEVVFWMPTGQEVPAALRQPGTTVYAAGELQEYRERMQLKLDEPSDVSTAPLPVDKLKSPGGPKALGTDASKGWPGREAGKAAPAPAKRTVEPGTTMSVREIGPDLAGNVITTVGTVESIPTGARQFTLRSADGYITVSGEPEAVSKVPTGQPVRLKGEVVINAHRGSAELKLVEILP